MKIVKFLFKSFLIIASIPIVYIIVSLLLISITVNKESLENPTQKIWLNTNGVHLDIIIHKKDLPLDFKKGMKYAATDNYFAFGWGEENFYLNTPSWNDLKVSSAFKALFLDNTTLVHMSRYYKVRSDWIEIDVSEKQLDEIINYISEAFQRDENGSVIILSGRGYKYRDDFYKANGSYSCFKTCNTWVNTGFKQSGLKACLWTPFDFGLMRKYQPD